MSCAHVHVNIRDPTGNDVGPLFQMITQSTGQRVKFDATSLEDDILKPKRCDGPEVNNDDPTVVFDPSLLTSNKPVAGVLLAEVEDTLIGYLISHYHFSPWTGHCAFIDDIFVKADHRNKGIAKRLFKELLERAKKDSLKSFLFKANMDSKLREKIISYGAKWYRNEQRDWSVYRLSL